MRSWAIVVGINAYPNLGAELQLHGAVADAVDFADWALHADGGAVAAADLFLWTYPPPPAGPHAGNASSAPWPGGGPPDPNHPPTVADVVALAMHLSSEMVTATGDHRIYVFFAGHGVQVESAEPQTCFVVGDFARIANLGLIPCDSLRRYLQTNGFREVIMFLDCCRTQLNYLDAAPNMFALGASVPTRHAVGRAAGRNQRAFEFPDTPPKRGAFTQALTEGLRRRRDADGVLTLNALEDYVYNRVPGLLTNKVQDPQFDIEPRNPPFPLIKSPPIQTLEAIRVLNLAPGDATTLHDRNNVLVETVTADAAGVAQFVAPLGASYTVSAAGRAAYSFRHDGPGAHDVRLDHAV